MQSVKIYNILNGIFYVGFGLWGLILPQRILAFFDIQTYGAYALHNIRALWAGLFVIGLLILWKGRAESTVMLGLTIALVTGSLAVGRLLGLVFDGMDSGSGATYYEIAFESTWMVIGLFLAKRASKTLA